MPLLPFQVSTEEKDAAQNNGCINKELAILTRRSECHSSSEQNQKHMVGTARVTVINKETGRKEKFSIRSVWIIEGLSRQRMTCRQAVIEPRGQPWHSRVRMEGKVPDDVRKGDRKRNALVAFDSEIVRRANRRSKDSVIARHVWKIQQQKEAGKNEARERFLAEGRDLVPEHHNADDENRSCIDAHGGL